MLSINIPLASPYTFVLTLLLLAFLGGVLVLWAPSRASAYEAEARLDSGATVSLLLISPAVLGAGVLKSRVGTVLVLLRCLGFIAIAAVPLGFHGSREGLYGGNEDVLRYGRGGSGVNASLRRRMVGFVQGVCRRNGPGGSKLYEMFDPRNGVTLETLDGLEERSFCAEPGVVKDVRLLYVNDGDDVLLPVDAVEPMMEGKAESKKVRVWGSIEDIKSVGSLACSENKNGTGSVCLYAFRANSKNQRAFIVLPDAGEVSRVSGIDLPGNFDHEAVNVTGLDNGFMERGVQRLIALQGEGEEPVKFTETLVLMDMVGPNPGESVRRVTGSREVTTVDVWALSLLGALCALAIALLVFFGMATGQKARMNDFSWAVRELMRTGTIPDPAMTKKARNGENASLLHLSGEMGGDKILCRRDYDTEGSRRFTGLSAFDMDN